VVDEPFKYSDRHNIPLVPGLFVDVELDGAALIEGVQIPRMAIRHGNEVYVEENGVLRKKAVSVIFSSAEFAVTDPATSEVRSGDRVIVSPVPGAFSGMSIQTQTISEPSSIAAPESLEADSAGDQSSSVAVASPLVAGV
jgi:hypothetical protein